MRAFVLSLIVLVAITAAAAFVLQLVPMSSSDVYSVRQNVRL
jgi:thiamine transporter ThiT